MRRLPIALLLLAAPAMGQFINEVEAINVSQLPPSCLPGRIYNLMDAANGTDTSSGGGDGSTPSLALCNADGSTYTGVDPQAAGGAGSPIGADYLVGTANGGLSAEIVVGTSPGGELGGTWATPTVDTTHSGTPHHVADGTGTDDQTAAEVTFSDPDSNFTAADVDAAVAEFFDVDGGGPNSSTGKVDWSQLVSVPAGFADGTDDGGGGGTDDQTAVEVPYAPTTGTDWVDPDPSEVLGGLDDLAGRLTIEEAKADDDTPDNDSEVPDAITVAGGTINTSSIVLDIEAADQTVDGDMDWDTVEEVIEVGDDGVATLKFYPGAHDGTGTDTLDDLSDDLPSALSNVTTLTNGSFCIGNAGGGFDCTTAGALADDDLSDDLPTVLSNVTTITDGQYCEGNAGGGFDCDQASIPAADLPNVESLVTSGGTDKHVLQQTGASTYEWDWPRARSHATDCTSLTDGEEGDFCWEIDANTFYVCEPAAGDCDTAPEWVSATAAGDGVGYDEIQDNDAAETKRAILNLISGGTVTVSCADDAGNSETDCTFTGSAHDGTGTDTLDDLSDDLITALSGVTTVTDGSFCQGGATSTMDCDVTQDNIAGAGHIDATTEINGAMCGTSEILEDQGASWACIATPAGGDLVDDASPQLGAQLDVNTFGLGDGTLELLSFVETGSAVNEVTITNAATGNAPSIAATGDNTDIDLILSPKGTGAVDINLDCSAGDQYITTDANGLIACGTDNSGGGATIDVEEDNASVDAAVTNLDFGSGFDVGSSPAGEANITLDFTETGLDLAAITNTQLLYDNADSLGGISQLTYDGTNLTMTPTAGDDIQAEEVVAEVHNATGATLFKCTAVYISGFNVGADLAEVSIADADAAAMPAVGLVRADITDGAAGFLVTAGDLINTDTTTGEVWSAGDAVYVNTSGTGTSADCGDSLTNVKPTGAALIQKVGIVSRVNASNGEIEVVGAGRSNDVPNIASTNLWVGNGSGVATAVAMSSEATMDNAGAVTVASSHSGSAHHSVFAFDVTDTDASPILTVDDTEQVQFIGAGTVTVVAAADTSNHDITITGSAHDGTGTDTLDDLSDDLPTALSNVTTITDTQFCVGNAGGGFDCTTAGALADDDVSDDLITALSGVTTVTDGSFCQGGAASTMDCDVAGVLADDDLSDDAITALSDVASKTGTGTAVVFSAAPALTGDATGATAAADDTDTSLATTAFVQQEHDDSAGSCTNQVVTAVNASAAPTCANVSAAMISDGVVDGEDMAATYAGAYLTETAGSPDSLGVDDKVVRRSFSFNLETPATGDSGELQHSLDVACTVDRIQCSTDTGTADVNIEERALATPNTAGSDAMSADLQCDNTSATSTTMQNQPIDATDPIALTISATASTPGWLRVHVTCKVDDA